MRLVHLDQLISIQIQTLWFHHNDSKTKLGQCRYRWGFRRSLNVPIYFTTDVNSSAYGEVVARNNAGGHIENLVYYTIGTGIGAGVIQRGEFIGELDTQKWDTTMWLNTQWMGKRIQGCLSFPQRLFGRFCGWSKSWKLVQVFVGKTLN